MTEDKECEVKFTMTDESVTVVDGGRTSVVRAGQPHFAELRRALLAEDWAAARASLTAADRVREWSKRDFALGTGGEVTYRGRPVPESFGRRVLAALAAGESVEPLLRFHERLDANPSYRSARMLFDFLQHVGIPIRPDGSFLAYKGVTRNYRDVHSQTCRDPKCGHQTYDNRPGQRHEMPRNQVSDDPEVPCHAGFHVGSIKYASEFGAVVVVCAVDPADVICVPHDCSQQKVRCCRYAVVGHLGEKLPNVVLDESASGEHRGAEPQATSAPAGPGYTAEHLMQLSMDDLRLVAASLKIAGASRYSGSRAAVVVDILRVQDSIAEAARQAQEG